MIGAYALRHIFCSLLRPASSVLSQDICVPLLLFFAFLSPLTNAQTALSTSPSGHFVTYKDKPLLLIGDSGTHCVLQDANLDYARWVADCAAAGLNAVHVWAFVAPRQQLDGSVVERRYGYVYPGLTPWARKTSGPRAADGGYCWDLHRWDEGNTPDHYWYRLRDLCRLTQESGLVLGITVFWGWPKHPDDWKYHPFNVLNGGPIEDQPAPHATQVQRIASPGTEVLDETWSDSWETAKKNQWLWERFCEKLIEETAAFDHVFFVFMDEHSYDEGNGGDHFRRFFQRRGCRWADWEKRRADVDYVFDPISHDKTWGRNKGAVERFHRTPCRPFLILEGGPYQGDVVRHSLWTAIMGGASYFFHNDEGQGSDYAGVMQYDPNVPRVTLDTRRMAWMGHAARFFGTYVSDLDALQPMNELTSPPMFYCLANPGSEYIVYAMPDHPEPVVLNLSDVHGTFSARFHDPRNGAFLAEQRIEGGVRLELPRPSDEDWVVLVQSLSTKPVCKDRE
ncbi:MAG TPA: hypothetical protein PKY35_13840 [Candidatus Hydrogenedentes bacterium]|nr:hypothetical protein [Candidatus Hydrogenedentota bacterium]HOL78101.1 hypothetical protein [Candidatus Hydrogenedentota bacterium]HPO86468.1 hypothetical protein [Candidatus Hydrogenedentota bacterium]